MAAPNIKLYLLPPSYTQASDNDVQEAIDDELLPVVVKQEPLNDVMPMRGVAPYKNAKCFPINFTAGQQSDTLTPVGGMTQYLAHNSPANVLVGPSGLYGISLADPSGNVINPTGYIIAANVSDPTLFDHISIPNPPSGVITMRYWGKAATPTQYWALPGGPVYSGPNTAISNITIVASGTGNPTYEGVSTYGNNLIADNASGVIHTPVAATSVNSTYWATSPVSIWFAGDHCNWIANHMRMHPDVFVGTEDYPGDDGTINGQPVIQGVVAEFCAIGTYSVEYRKGLVRFPSAVDSTQTVVQANYAYLSGMNNVTSQVLDPVDRQLSEWYAAPSGAIYLDMPVTGGGTHKMSVYMIDYDNEGRSQKIDLLDGNYNLLATHTVNSFANGVISRFNIAGTVKLRVTSLNIAHSPTVSAVYFDSTTGSANTYLSDDTATQGSWKGVYGSDGYIIIGDTAYNPSYVTPSPSGQSSLQWITQTLTDTRAIQRVYPLVFQARSETFFTASHGRRWSALNTEWNPQNFYSNGVLTGVPNTVVPYETLTVKMS